MTATTRKLNRALTLSAMLAMVVGTGPARAGLFDAQAQVIYDLTEVKQVGLPVVSNGRFFTSYNLLLRRPLLPFTSLVTDLSFNSSETSDNIGTQNTRNWAFNAYARQPTYTIIGRITNTGQGTLSNLGGTSFKSNTREYNTSLLLRNPAYPVVNLQFQRSISDNQALGSASSDRTTNVLFGAYYDMSPLRFTFDRTQSSFTFAGSGDTRSVSQRSAALIDHPLMSGLTLSGQISRSSTNADFGTNTSSVTTDQRLIRLTAIPTGAVSANIDFSSQSNAQVLGLGLRQRSSNDSVSWSVRSEIVHGLSLDYSDQHQTQVGSTLVGTTNVDSTDKNLGLSARLGEDTVLTFSSDRSIYEVTPATGNTTQNSYQTSLQTNLTPATSLNLNYGRNNVKIGPTDGYSNRSSGISIRDRTSDRLSLGIGYRHSEIVSQFGGEAPLSQRTDALDFDTLWLPTTDLGINLRLSYQANNGSNISYVLAPSGNARWQIDSSTSLTVNYTLDKQRLFDSVSSSILGQATKGLSLRLTHGFTNNSTLDLSYDFQGSNFGSIQWQRELRLSFTTRL